MTESTSQLNLLTTHQQSSTSSPGPVVLAVLRIGTCSLSISHSLLQHKTVFLAYLDNIATGILLLIMSYVVSSTTVLIAGSTSN